MNWLLVCRLLGMIAVLVGASMACALPWGMPWAGQVETWEYNGIRGLLGGMGISLALGLLLLYVGRRERGTIFRREALAVVGTAWLMAGVLGALPYLFSETRTAPDEPMDVSDALFESLSGFTTTGASVLTAVEDPTLVPRSILFWRSFTHWLGGAGIVVLFVAVLGLGAGGKQLVRREISTALTETFRPRIRETALAIVWIYVGLSVLLMALLVAQGMSLFDALCHTFGTIATGGFSTQKESIGAYGNLGYEITIIAFMFLAGTNFALFHKAVATRQLDWWRDREYRWYVLLLFGVIAVLTVDLRATGQYETVGESLRYSSFHALAIMTTTGYATADFNQWPDLSRGILLILMYVGGSAGSTAGGMKVIRFVLFLKILRLELEQAFRPKLVRPLRVGGQVAEASLRHDVVVYVSLLLAISMTSWLAIAAIEPDSHWAAGGDPESPQVRSEKLIDCLSAVAATLNCVGPGLGVLGPSADYSGFTPASKLIFCVLMVLGRLELFALLVWIVPAFWRRQ